jgi:hypothetical protein
MRTALPLVVVLAACSGGGGGSQPPFTPSANLAESHPWLVGLWVGPLRVPSTGIDYTAGLNFDALLQPTSSAAPVFDSFAPGFPHQRVDFEADGDRVRFACSLSDGSNYTTAHFAGAVQDHYVMHLTWSMESTVAVWNGLSGTADLARVGGPAAARIEEEVFSTDDLLLVVRREWR